MAGPNSFQQTIEFAHEVNARSEQDVLRQRENFLRSLQDADQGADAAQGVLVDQGEGVVAGTEQRYLDDYGQHLAKRSGARRDEVKALERGEEARGQQSGDAFSSWLQRRRGQELGLDESLGTIEGRHVGVMSGTEQKVGTTRAKSLDWLDRVRVEAQGIVGSLVRRYNQFASITGLVRIPTSMTEFARFAKDQHDRLRTELGRSLQASALSGWRLGDVRSFMVALNEQRAEFPSLASELDQTVDTLARNLPDLGGGKTLDLGSDIRRAAFLLGDGADVVAKDVAELSRLTKRSGDDVVASFLTVRNIAGSTRAKGGHDPEVAVGVLRKFFVDLVRQGVRYGVTLEEAAALTRRYSGAIERDAISTQDLIRFITGFTTTEAGNKSSIAFDIVSKLEGRHELKKLVAEIQPLFRRGDVEGAALLMDALVTGSTVTLQRDFGIAPREAPELRREVIASIHEIVGGWVAANTVQDQHIRRYVEDVILNEFGVGGQGTYDQHEIARTFRLRSERLRGGLDPDAKARVDAEMQRRENEFDKIAGRTNAVLLRLSNSVDSVIRNFDLQDIDVAWDKLKTGVASIPGKAVQYVAQHFKKGELWPFIKESTEKWGQKIGINPKWLQAQIAGESGGSPTAFSHAGAMGLTQFIPGTARRYLKKLGIPEPKNLREFLNANPDIMIQMQAAYMKDIEEIARSVAPNASDEEIFAMMLAGYNAGEDRMRKEVETHGADWLLHMPGDTRDYVPTVLRYLRGLEDEVTAPAAGAKAGAGDPAPVENRSKLSDLRFDVPEADMSAPERAYYDTLDPGEHEDHLKLSPATRQRRVQEWINQAAERSDKLRSRSKEQSRADTYRVTVAAISMDAAYNKVLGTFARGGVAGLQGIGAVKVGGAA